MLETVVFELFNRKVLKGGGDRFRYKIELKHVSPLGIVERQPIDVTGWSFTMCVHKYPAYKETDSLFTVVGSVANAANGTIIFEIPKENTNLEANTYWYSILYTKANGCTGIISGAKYKIVDTFNPYFSIYPETVQNQNFIRPVRPSDFTISEEIEEGQEK